MHSLGMAPPPITSTSSGSRAHGSSLLPSAACLPASDTTRSSPSAPSFAATHPTSITSPARRRADLPTRVPPSRLRSASVFSPATPWRRRRRGLAAIMATRVGMPRWPPSRWQISSTDSMPRTRVETRARARVLQALYAWDLRGEAQLERVASQIWDDLSVSPEERRIAGSLVRTLAQHSHELDAELAEVTT